jgi:DNA-binding NarL/FixJ family response regulator
MVHSLILVEDNLRLRQALKGGLEATSAVRVVFDCEDGEAALEYCLASSAQQEKKGHPLPDLLLLDVKLAGKMNGIQTAIAIRREFPRQPVVFYSIQDEDVYYRDFRQSGILSHYAYVRKSNYLLPQMIVPLIQDVVTGRSIIDPEIEARVQEVRQLDENDPMALLEPNEQIVARLLAQGLTNEQIAAQLGFRDKRTISRTNGQIYAAWGLSQSTTDEKIARTRAALIVQARQLISWDENGQAFTTDARGDWKCYTPP